MLASHSNTIQYIQNDCQSRALLPECSSRGIGTTLVRELQTEAQAASRPLRIHVERFNPARRLYERLGFREIEDKGGYLFMEWKGGFGEPIGLRNRRLVS